MEICEDFFHTEAEHVDRPRNKWRTGEICCNRMRSVSSIRSAMASRALQDIVLNIPDWARLDHTDSMPPLPNPLPKKRSAEASLTAEVPSKRSKCDVMRTCATQSLDKTSSGSPHEPMVLGSNNNNSSRPKRKRKKSKPCRTRRRSRSRSESCPSSRTSRSRSRGSRRGKGILKPSRSSHRGTPRGRRRSKRKVHFSKKITYWEASEKEN